MIIIGSWLFLYFEMQKTASYKEQLKQKDRELIEANELSEAFFNMGSNLKELTDEKLRICQKAIPLLIEHDISILNAFNMAVFIQETEGNWIVELTPKATIGGGLQITLDKKTESVVSIWHTQ